MPCFGLLSTHLLSPSGTAPQLSLLYPRGSCGNWHVTDDRCRHVSSVGNTSLPSISYLTTVKPTSLVYKCSWCAGFVIGDEVRAECGGRTSGAVWPGCAQVPGSTHARAHCSPLPAAPAWQTQPLSLQQDLFLCKLSESFMSSATQGLH